MRMWHKKLVPHLCKNHLLAQWREGLGLYEVLQNKEGYYNHPQAKMYHDARHAQWELLKATRKEMLNRGWNPKELPPEPEQDEDPDEWQSLERQIELLQDKSCECNLEALDILTQ